MSFHQIAPLALGDPSHPDLRARHASAVRSTVNQSDIAGNPRLEAECRPLGTANAGETGSVVKLGRGGEEGKGGLLLGYRPDVFPSSPVLEPRNPRNGALLLLLLLLLLEPASPPSPSLPIPGQTEAAYIQRRTSQLDRGLRDRCAQTDGTQALFSTAHRLRTNGSAQEVPPDRFSAHTLICWPLKIYWPNIGRREGHFLASTRAAFRPATRGRGAS
jgi:hypothetical protein